MKKQKSYHHVVEYYKNNVLLKSAIVTEVINRETYFNDLKNNFAKFDRSYIEADNYTLINSCINGSYHFLKHQIVEINK